MRLTSFKYLNNLLNMNEDQIITAFAALAQQHRLRTYRALVVAGPEGVTAGVLASALGLSPAALSFHLKELTHAGLISPAQEGRFVRYHANYAQMNTLLQFMTDNCCAGSAKATTACAPTPCCPPGIKKTSIKPSTKSRKKEPS